MIILTIFCILAFRDLGPNSLVRPLSRDRSLGDAFTSRQTLLCTAYDGDTLERFAIWPVAGLLAIGTIAWLATIISLLRVRPCDCG